MSALTGRDLKSLGCQPQDRETLACPALKGRKRCNGQDWGLPKRLCRPSGTWREVAPVPGVDTPGWSNSALSGRRPRRSATGAALYPISIRGAPKRSLGMMRHKSVGASGISSKDLAKMLDAGRAPGASEPATGCGPHKQSTLRKTVRCDLNCRLPINERNGRILKCCLINLNFLAKIPWLGWNGPKVIELSRTWFEGGFRELTASPEPAHAGRVEELACMRTYMMMMGFAFENLAKAIFITRDHSIVSNANLGTWPMSRGGHGFAKAIKSILSQLSPVDENLLLRLEEYVVWAGRYPIPKSARAYKAAEEAGLYKHASSDVKVVEEIFSKLEKLVGKNEPCRQAE